MIKIFAGDDRIRAKQAIVQFLGQDYEVFDGPDLMEDDLLNICSGNSLLSLHRSILIRDLSKNKSLFEKIPDYLDTQHSVALLEQKLDKRSSVYKALKEKKLVFQFDLNPGADYGKVFNIFSVAKQNGPKAIDTLEEIKNQEDPMMFFGLLASSAIKDFGRNQGTKEKQVLKLLSRLDLRIKSSSMDPWLLIESFLVQLSRLYGSY